MLRPFETNGHWPSWNFAVGQFEFLRGPLSGVPSKENAGRKSRKSCQAALHGCLPVDSRRSKPSTQGERKMRQAVHTGNKPVARRVFFFASPQPVLFPT